MADDYDNFSRIDGQSGADNVFDESEAAGAVKDFGDVGTETSSLPSSQNEDYGVFGVFGGRHREFHSRFSGRGLAMQRNGECSVSGQGGRGDRWGRSGWGRDAALHAHDLEAGVDVDDVAGDAAA